MNKQVIEELTDKAWCLLESTLSECLIDSLFQLALKIEGEEDTRQAQIGRSLEKEVNQDIRKGQIRWIDQFDNHPGLIEYRNYLNNFKNELNYQFYLSIKRFESQFAFYNKNDFYLKHLDQHAKTRHRQVTHILYLNDCAKGGELVIFNRSNKNMIDTIIKPKRGLMVTFFSSQIFHEVKTTEQKRYSLTTWFRDDMVTPFV